MSGVVHWVSASLPLRRLKFSYASSFVSSYTFATYGLISAEASFWRTTSICASLASVALQFGAASLIAHM